MTDPPPARAAAKLEGEGSLSCPLEMWCCHQYRVGEDQYGDSLPQGWEELEAAALPGWNCRSESDLGPTRTLVPSD